MALDPGKSCFLTFKTIFAQFSSYALSIYSSGDLYSSFICLIRWLMNPQIFEVILDKLNQGTAIVIDVPMVSTKNEYFQRCTILSILCDVTYE